VPAHIDLIRIDWHLAETPVELHGAISQAHARCTGTDHTFDTVREQLAKAVAGNPGLVADALVDSGYNSFVLLRARDGVVHETPVVEIPEGLSSPIDLPYDDCPFDVDLSYGTEDALREAVEGIAPSEPGRFVATAGHDRFLVEVTPEEWRLHKLVAVTEPALFARLWHERYPEPKRAGRDPDQRYGQPLFWPVEMLEFLTVQATRLDRSLSWLVQYSLRVLNLEALARVVAEGLPDLLGLADTPRQRQTLYFQGAQLDLMEAQAARLDTSTSAIAQIAVALAKRQIEKMPDRIEPGFA
jgi:hypothetical protein